VKTSDKFRFSLQWGVDSFEKVQAGELLENLGNRKSEFVVLAVTEYLAAHPEALAAGRKLQIVVKPSYTHEQVKAIVLAVLEDKMSGIPRAPQELHEAAFDPNITEMDIDEMLKNLDAFQ
jgi:hypothetical protein